MRYLKNTSKWNKLFILNSKQVLISKDITQLELDFLESRLSELVYRRRKAVLQNELIDIQTEQNNLRNQLYEG